MFIASVARSLYLLKKPDYVEEGEEGEEGEEDQNF